ncbi:MAG: PAS domain S-box protein, partial [Steroidobacteraceae bacterium]|nr:PAS domain S-box protein [Deltaproteobacteria bacterium]
MRCQGKQFGKPVRRPFGRFGAQCGRRSRDCRHRRCRQTALGLKITVDSVKAKRSHQQLLQIRQHELELQVEELRRANTELESSRNKYALLYDFAPVGYFTFDRQGGIRTVNLTGANLLGLERPVLVDRHFEHFVADKDRPTFAEFLRTVFACHDKMTCRLKLSKGDSQPVFVR